MSAAPNACMTRRFVVVAIGMVLGLLPAVPVVAGNFDLTGVAGFDQFTDDHPATAAQLDKNPALVHDDEWMRKHPTLLQFFREHPMAEGELDDAPEINPDDGEPGEDGQIYTKKKPGLLASPLTNPLLSEPSPVVNEIRHPPSATDE
jgi:hypothetical protein